MSLDTDLLVAAGRLRRPGLDRVMAFYSTLGNFGYGWVAVGAALALARWDLRPLVVCAIVVWGTLGLNFSIKSVVRRPRPAGEDIAATLVPVPTSHSFPSSHAAMSAAAALALVALEPAALPLVVPAALVMAASRVYLAVHYPSDVVVGLVVGTLAGLGLLRLVGA